MAFSCPCPPFLEGASRPANGVREARRPGRAFETSITAGAVPVTGPGRRLNAGTISGPPSGTHTATPERAELVAEKKWRVLSHAPPVGCRTGQTGRWRAVSRPGAEVAPA